jgi:hypothetical protein
MLSRRRASTLYHTSESQLTLTASRFFLRKNDKTEIPLPAPLSNVSSSTLVVAEERGARRDSKESTLFRFPQVSHVSSTTPGSGYSSLKLEDDSVKVKPRPSFAALRSKSASYHLYSYVSVSC